MKINGERAWLVDNLEPAREGGDDGASAVAVTVTLVSVDCAQHSGILRGAESVTNRTPISAQVANELETECDPLIQCRRHQSRQHGIGTEDGEREFRGAEAIAEGCESLFAGVSFQATG